jgi:pilus assembly protein Flp/PilA
MDLLKRLWKDEEGQGLVEYGLILLLVVVIVAAVVTIFEPDIKALFNRIGDEIDGADDGI